MLRQSLNTARKYCLAIAGSIERFGSTVLTAMMLLTVTDIILRRFFNSPLPYSFELVEVLLVVVAYSYIVYTTSVSRHISVDTFTSRFPFIVRKRLVIIGDFIAIMLFGLIGWQSIAQGIHLYEMGQTTAILHLPKFPFQFFLGAGGILACIFLLIKVLNSLLGGKE
jgi:TRAP-type C4-dicarboxylate transport system permease small subunit